MQTQVLISGLCWLLTGIMTIHTYYYFFSISINHPNYVNNSENGLDNPELYSSILNRGQGAEGGAVSGDHS